MAPVSSFVAPYGAHLAHRLPRRTLEIGFGCFLLAGLGALSGEPLVRRARTSRIMLTDSRAAAAGRRAPPSFAAG